MGLAFWFLILIPFAPVLLIVGSVLFVGMWKRLMNEPAISRITLI